MRVAYTLIEAAQIYSKIYIMRIRNIEPADYSAATGLYNLLFPEFRILTLTRLCDLDISNSWVLIHDNRIIGISIQGMRYFEDAYIPYIFAFGIHPEFQRRGLGNFLMSVACRFSPLYLTTRISNAAAIRLYQNHGFEVESIEEKLYISPREDGLFMKLIR